jgi:hypothetical protein
MVFSSKDSSKLQAQEDSSKLQAHIRETVTGFVEGMKDAVNDLSALEVNTMVVSEISGLKFNPRISYRLLYDISELDSSGLRHLKDRLREAVCEIELEAATDPERKQQLELQQQELQLELQLKELQKQPQSETNLAKQNQLGKGQAKLRNELKNNLYTLPKPFQDARLDALLKNKNFVLRLRKLNELRSLLKKPRASETDNIYDNIYAQTIIQLDGDVINYFHKRLFEETHTDDRAFLMTIHRDAVTSGQQNWQSILHLIFDMMSQIPKIFSSSFK